MAKRPFIRKQKRRRHGTAFWDQEYTNATHLKLSTAESEDLAKFTRWLLRRTDKTAIDQEANVVDLGCGNGRNLIYLANTFKVKGTGYDSSAAAIKQATAAAKDLPLTFLTRSIADPLPLPDNSHSLALDMMSSHFLNARERASLRDEIYRVLVPGGWLFMKTFLGDGDLHTKRLLEEYPGKEPGTYIHPALGVPEHVYFEEELVGFLEERFIVHKIYRSHKHMIKGKAHKRRTVSIYAEKDLYTA